jgi:phytoene desaturase
MRGEFFMTDYDVIIIGAGCGGLSAGAQLAKQGRKVLVLEQNDRVGGCCSTFEKEGYSFDVGASIVEIAQPIDRVFKILGSSMDQELDLIACDPIVTCILRDGSRITYPATHEGTMEALSHFSPQDARNWKKYNEYFYELTDVAYDTLFCEPANNIGDVLKWFKKNPKLLKFLPGFFVSYQTMMEKYFCDKTRQSFAFQSMYFGLPPYLLPGIFALVPCTEHRGLYYPRGGMIQIPLALLRCGERFGMQLKLNSSVEKVLIEKRRVYGVQLKDGTKITSKVVVSDVNAKLLYQKMICKEHLPRLVQKGVESYEYAMSVPMVFLGVNEKPPLDAHHTLISPTVEELNKYWKNQNRQPIPEKQFGLIGWSTFTDTSMAPAGKHALNLTMTGAYDLQGKNWDAEKPRFIDDVIKQLSSSVIPGLSDHVEVSTAVTPLDFERRVGIDHGAIYGLAQNFPTETVFRPSNKSKCIEGLYLAGASTSPGGGVPTTIASGMITSNLIEKYEK